MRGVFPALQRLGQSLGVSIELEDKQVAVGIAAAHGTNIEGVNHG